MLGRLVRAAMPVGLPVVAHVYAKGNQVPPGGLTQLSWVRYAARVGAEIGADIVKVPYTGSVETYAEVVETCPVPVVASGGPRVNSLEELFRQVRGVMDAGAKGTTIGRNVWADPNIPAILAALRAIVHQGARVSAGARHLLQPRAGRAPASSNQARGSSRWLLRLSEPVNALS